LNYKTEECKLDPYKGKKIDSNALRASGLDALFDSVLSLSTLIGMIIAKYANVYIEGYLGILIGIFIIKSGFEVLKESLSSMIGDRFEKEYINEIKNEILNVSGVLGCYDLILNSYGHNKNIGSVHIGVSDELTAIQIQAIEREISNIMYNKYDTIMTIGIYAENLSDDFSKNIYGKILEIINKYEHVLQIHGFYVDYSSRSIYYDLVISFDDDKPAETIRKIKEETLKIINDYNIVINYDQDFSLS
jgi:divalent metal cation (Fe/Co/Zn/Cd) transporter